MDIELPAWYQSIWPCAHKPKFLRPKTAFRNDCTFGFRFNHVQILPQTMVVIMMVVVLTMIAKIFTSVVCSCFAFRDLLTESITIEEYLFSLSPLNTCIFYTYIIYPLSSGARSKVSGLSCKQRTYQWSWTWLVPTEYQSWRRTWWIPSHLLF